MKSISFDSNDGIFEGKIMLYITNTSHLLSLMKDLKEVEGIKEVDRIELNS